MNEAKRYLKFRVTICLGYGDGGDVRVKVGVTEKEYERLKQCCRDEEDSHDRWGLKGLCRRIEREARYENENCMSDFGCGEKINYQYASYLISIPHEIYEEVEKEKKEEDNGTVR